MSGFLGTATDSLKIFLENPKFVVPKLVIAFLYSVQLLFTVDLTAQAIFSPSIAVLGQLVLLLITITALNIADIIASGMYPFMVEAAGSGKRVSLRQSLHSSLSISRVLIPSVLLVELLFLASAFIMAVPLDILLASDSSYAAVFTALYTAAILAFVFLFYNLYPVIAFENQPMLQSLRRSASLSLSGKAMVAKATILSFLLSGLSFGIALAMEFFPGGNQAAFWAGFVIVRVLTGYVYAYLYVLNPVFYLEQVRSPGRALQR